MQQAFPSVQQVRYEGPATTNPLAFRHYDPSALVEGKPMRDHLRFAACYWHTMRNGLADPFGAPTALMPWDDGSSSVDNALRRVDAFIEFLTKCQIDWYCFHDRDLAPEGATPWTAWCSTWLRRPRPLESTCCGARPACLPIRATWLALAPAPACRSLRTLQRR